MQRLQAHLSSPGRICFMDATSQKLFALLKGPGIFVSGIDFIMPLQDDKASDLFILKPFKVEVLKVVYLLNLSLKGWKTLWEKNLFVWGFMPYQQYLSYLTLSQTSPCFYVSAVQGC